MATAGSLVAQALRAALNLTPGEGLDGADAEQALTVMNSLLAAWSGEAFTRPTSTLEPFTLTAGQASYTVGTGGQMNTTRPDELVNAFLRDSSGTDTPLRIASREEYLGLPVKTTGGDPDSVYYDPTAPLGTLYLYPVPARTLTLWLDSLKPVAQFSSVAATLQLPGEYEEALKYLTAERLCVDYGFPISQDLRALIMESRSRLKKKNARVRPPVFDPMLRGAGVFDITSGTSRF